MIDRIVNRGGYSIALYTRPHPAGNHIVRLCASTTMGDRTVRASTTIPSAPSASLARLAEDTLIEALLDHEIGDTINDRA